MRRALGAGLLLFISASCGGEASPPSGSEATTTTASGSTVTTTAVGTPREWAVASDVGLESMTLLTPTGGLGERPDLAWESVQGAASYAVTVRTPEGAIYWGWNGQETSIPLGGLPRLSDAATGPRLVSGMTWTVVAYDADHRPLAMGGPSLLSR